MISIGIITARPDPKFDWFFQSLRLQGGLESLGQIILIDFFAQPCDNWTQNDVDKRREVVMKQAADAGFYNYVEWHPPMPTVWAGPNRLPKDNWWHAAACRNTVLCHAKHEFVACLDDRFVLMPTWMDAVRQAEQEKYVVCGTYQKRSNMTVVDGVIQHGGTITGEDSRLKVTNGHKFKCGGPWCFGCTFALPLEWALNVNGVDSTCDGLSMEDVIFGNTLTNAGYPIYYDPRMSMVEDRTPGQLGTPMRREDKGISPNDKSHGLLSKMRGVKRAIHPIDLRKIRDSVLAGNPFPPAWGPTEDWWDGQKTSEMK